MPDLPNPPRVMLLVDARDQLPWPPPLELLVLLDDRHVSAGSAGSWGSHRRDPANAIRPNAPVPSTASVTAIDRLRLEAFGFGAGSVGLSG